MTKLLDLQTGGQSCRRSQNRSSVTHYSWHQVQNPLQTGSRGTAAATPAELQVGLCPTPTCA
eukprot:4469095-Amphidinium_carterae.2